MNRHELLMSWGLRYLRAGWSIIPVKPKGKEPLLSWTEFQSRKATEAELTEWLAKWPEMNLGVVTGPLSNLAIVDLDGITGITSGQSLGLVSPVLARTGNGKQVFYKWQVGIKNSVKKIAPGVDIRGEGGFVVVCPSTHPSGKMYRWERFVPALIPDFPTALLAATNTDLLVKSENTTAHRTKEPDWLSAALEEMKNGHTHNTLVSILGRFRRYNFSIGDTVRLLQPHCFDNGKPFEGLAAKVEEIWNRYEPAEAANVHSARAASPIYSGSTELHIKSPTNNNDFEQFRLQGIHKSGDIFRTGFPTLDKYCEGGLKSERLFTVAARTGTGKTNFAIALARHLCEAGKKVLFFSTEYTYQKVWHRYIATLSNPDTFKQHAFYVCDSFSPHLSQVEEAIKQVAPDVFIFDHINHIGELREGLGEFMQGCNFLQRKYNAQGIMIAQLNRQADWVENGKRVEPRMSMIKGSGTIEQASSRILLLSEIRITPEFNEVLGVLDKNDSGDRGTISFGLYKNPYHFREL